MCICPHLLERWILSHQCCCYFSWEWFNATKVQFLLFVSWKVNNNPITDFAVTLLTFFDSGQSRNFGQIRLTVVICIRFNISRLVRLTAWWKWSSYFRQWYTTITDSISVEIWIRFVQTVTGTWVLPFRSGSGSTSISCAGTGISSLSSMYASFLMYIRVLWLFKVTPFFVQSNPSLIARCFHPQNTQTFLINWTCIKGNRIINYLQQWQLDNSSGTFCTLWFSDATRKHTYEQIF